MMLGAEVKAISNSSLQTIRFLSLRAYSTNNFTLGILHQKESLSARKEIQ